MSCSRSMSEIFKLGILRERGQHPVSIYLLNHISLKFAEIRLEMENEVHRTVIMVH